MRWALMLILLLLSGCHAAREEDPARFTTETHRLTLAGKEVGVDYFLPTGRAKAPVVIVAHGFMGSRENMAGWGERLAMAGFLAVIPDMPYFSDHDKNADALVELVVMVRERKLGINAHPDRLALVGFSAGGFESLLAMVRCRDVACWVGLDPVDYKGQGEKAAGKRSFPALLLRAEPSKCNQKGNCRDWPKVLKGPVKMIQIPNSTHCDFEDPPSQLCRFACGQRDPDRHHQFVAYTITFLRANLN